MKKTLKWLFISPIFLFGLWIIGLSSSDFRETFINTTKRILKTMEREIERSL